MRTIVASAETTTEMLRSELSFGDLGSSCSISTSAVIRLHQLVKAVKSLSSVTPKLYKGGTRGAFGFRHWALCNR